MKKASNQGHLDLVHQETLDISDALYYANENTKIGRISRLALEPGTKKFQATLSSGSLCTLVNEAGVSFEAELKKPRNKRSKGFEIKGCVKDIKSGKSSYFAGVNINGIGPSGKSLRPAQLGAIHSLMAHWSLSQEPATVVLPTGVGKTEAMLAASIVDRAKRTLVIVPSIELKDQISEKFSSWGMLRELGVIPASSPNPTVLVLNKTLKEKASKEIIEKADVIVTTPAFIARADRAIKTAIKDSFSHVFFDEAHHVVASEWNEIKGLFKDAKIVQFTATPYRNDHKPIEGKVVYNYPLSRALEDKCFSKISLVTVDERHPRKKDKAIADAAMDRLVEDRKNGYNKHRMMVRAYLGVGPSQPSDFI